MNLILTLIVGIMSVIGMFTPFQSGQNVGATILFPSGGGTGTSTAPTYGKLLMGWTDGKYILVSTSSLGIQSNPGGSDTQIQFNDGGVFGGDSGFTWNKTTNKINLGTSEIYDDTNFLNLVNATGVYIQTDPTTSLTLNPHTVNITTFDGAAWDFTATSTMTASGYEFRNPFFNFYGNLDFTLLSANRNFVYPDTTGTLCLIGVICDGSTTTSNTWAGTQTYSTATSSNLIGNFASSTIHAITGVLKIPTFAALTTTVAGMIGIDTTSGQLRWFDGANTHVALFEDDKPFALSTSTLAQTGAFGSAGTTSTRYPGYFKRVRTLTDLYCVTLGATTTLRFGNGSATTTLICGKDIAGSASSLTTQFGARTPMFVDVGTLIGTGGSYVNITPTWVVDQD